MGLFGRRRDETRGLPPGAAAAPVGAKAGVLKRLPWEIRFLLLAPIYVGLPLGVALAAAFIYYTALIPNPMALRHKERVPVIRMLARDGSLLAERGSPEDYVPIDLLPRHLINAVVATEDRRFFEHRGLDPLGLLRAVFANLRAGRVAQGGSTLTQQLAKNLFLTSARTMSRKLEEVVLALWLEVRLGKRDILELYLNRVYFGGGAYGVETASRRFFDKSAQELTLTEAATLAGLLKAPSKFSPAGNPAVARARARDVLAKMADAGFLTPQEREEASQVALRFSAALRDDSGVDYAVDAVMERLPQLVGTLAGDLVVETTFDRSLQRRAQSIVQEALAGGGRKADAGQVGLVLLDHDGGVRCLIGGRSYAESQFNRALKAKRQPGSAFKMFVYLAALESGLTPDSIVQDLPILGSGWSPRNEGAGYRGAVTLRDALAHSMNAAAARLHMMVGPRKTAAVARRLGIRSDLREEASLALGTSEVTLLELTGAYGVIAGGGYAVEPYMINRVRTGAGQVLYQHPQQRGKAIVAPAQVAALNDMLGAVISSGTGRRAALASHPAAGKTGTSQDFRDAWFIGYTARFTGGVWVGNDDGRPMQKVMGGNLPATLWHDVMTAAHDGSPPQALVAAVRAPPLAPLPPSDRPPAERVGPEQQPRLPKERIDDGFVARALEPEGAAQASGRSAAPPRPPRSWVGTMLDSLKDGLGFGT
jgi:penicillin-binding protein 1A